MWVRVTLEIPCRRISAGFFLLGERQSASIALFPPTYTPPTKSNMANLDAMDFVKKFALAGKPRLLSYESKEIAILGDLANYSFVFQPKPFLTFGFTSQILSYEGLDSLSEKQHLAKVFFGSEINELLVGDSFKELDKRLIKLTNDLPSTLNKLSILYFQKYENHPSSDRIPKSPS